MRRRQCPSTQQQRARARGDQVSQRCSRSRRTEPGALRAGSSHGATRRGARAKEGTVMAVVMQMHWEGVNPAQYDEVRELVGWERTTPPRPLFHVAWFAEGSLNMFELWQSAEDF